MKPGRRYRSSSDGTRWRKRLPLGGLKRENETAPDQSPAPIVMPPMRLLPGAVVHRVLVSCAGRHQAPAERPLVIVVEAFARVGGGRRVEDAPQPQIGMVEDAAGLGHQIM